jgi:phage terminase large subunit
VSFSNSDLRRAAKRLIDRWGPDPVLFAKEALGLDVWDDGADYDDQASILRAITKHRKVACRSGQKTGKSTGVCISAMHWALTKPRGMVVISAPSFHQVKNIIWTELSRLYQEAPVPLGGSLHKDPASGWELSGNRRVFCVTTDKPERLQGLSGENLLCIVDEGSGYPDELWAPIFGNMQSGGSLLTTGNPTKTSGPFFDAFAHPESWELLHIDSENTPNARTGQRIIPGLATREAIETNRREWGEESAAYQVRVKGNFPTQADNAVIALGLVLAAEQRWRSLPDPEDTLVLGVDVARFGDDESVIQPRRGLKAFEPKFRQGMDIVQLAGLVRQVAREMRSGRETVRVNIDEIGVGGGLVDILQQDGDLDVNGINVAERATADGYALLRDQLWFGCADWLKEGGAIPEDPKLHSELVAPTYKFDAQGRQKVESKDDIKKRLGRSPDRADALCLSTYSPPDFGETIRIRSTRR